MKTLYFCIGDYRNGSKQYRIVKVREMADVHQIADDLGLEVVLDNCLLLSTSPDYMERMVYSALNAIETKLFSVENVVACHRKEYDEAQRMKQHFLNSDMSLYFPKHLSEPEEFEFDGRRCIRTNRVYPWIIEYYDRKRRANPNTVVPLRYLDEAETRMVEQAVVEKRKRNR